tara:strand:- start:1013 stop:1123 length:111 start_codon:yes stop_codon:yes gene_type:complete
LEENDKLGVALGPVGDLTDVGEDLRTEGDLPSIIGL